VTLSADVPIRSCVSCGFSYTDDEGQKARHDAVCRHLEVMTPREIEGIRKNYGLTRHEFAKLTQIGEASLARWENGLLIQNPGNDQFLYLLNFPDNLDRLRTRTRGHVQSSLVLPERRSPISAGARFRVLEITAEHRRKSQAFRLVG